MADIDITDLKLLSALQLNSKTSIAQLAETCAASTASVQRRLRRLRKSRVIERETIEIDRRAIGFEVKAIVSVELERDSAAETSSFKLKAKADSSVQHCYCIAGDVDFMLIVVAKDMDDYEAFTHRFFYADKNIRKFRTSIVVSEQKASNALPVFPQPTL